MSDGKEDMELPALQVIVLGSGGGPKEDNTTAFLVRSTAESWRRGSVLAVDAGTHLAAIVRIIEPYVAESIANSVKSPRYIISGPFEGLELPHVSASANAAHITRFLVDTYLITHPHLDHISGFVVNTAALPGSRPKRLAGLPSTIAAFKTHIFNNVIWPNLSDENDGAGLVTYMRLVEGGSPAIGHGEGKGYVEICEGLSVKTWSVSHGHCMENHSHRGSSAGMNFNSARSSHDDHDPPPMMRSYSNPMSHVGFSHISSSPQLDSHTRERICVYDSSAYFIRDIATGREVLMFGDVEPDSISLSPRNWKVWQEAGPKIASGILKGIFIECSYDNSQTDDTLFGHLAPRFLIEELAVLAREVQSVRFGTVSPHTPSSDSKKRKRPSQEFRDLDNLDGPSFGIRSRPRLPSVLGPQTTERQAQRISSFDSGSGSGAGLSPLTQHPPNLDLDGAQKMSLPDRSAPVVKGLLEGLKVVIIHVKDKMNDGPSVGDSILTQMKEYEQEMGLGCEFVIAKVGMSVYL